MTDELASFDAAPVMAQLMGFQRHTVEHVIDRFYGPEPVDGFLVADETGLGKTVVARGVIARTIEELQHRDEVDRVDVVYVCSNQDLARQNLRKLNVTGAAHHGMASRLTLLAEHSRRFTQPGQDGLVKAVNLVSFTPGTSFSRGFAAGTARERAMVYLMLEKKLGLTGGTRRRAWRLFRGGVSSDERFAQYVEELRADLRRDLAAHPSATGQGTADLPDLIDPAIAVPFLEAAASDGLLDRCQDLLDRVRDRRFPGEEAWQLTGALRTLLARESMRLLTPDLVILDEFQRFRELLVPDSEAGELAHHLFDCRAHDGHRAKTLLLSATPFKAFTFAEEARFSDEDHHRDFLQLVEFLAGERDDITDDIAAALRDYRQAVVTGRADAELTDRVRHSLLRVMSRTERPRILARDTSVEVRTTLEVPTVDDLRGYVAMQPGPRRQRRLPAGLLEVLPPLRQLHGRLQALHPDPCRPRRPVPPGERPAPAGRHPAPRHGRDPGPAPG